MDINIKKITEKKRYDFNDLREIMEILRSENGCPWDKEQTHASIRNNFIEETYEVVEGIDSNDNDILKEELGDVLLQVVFHTRMAEEEGAFNIDDVTDGICKKLIRRHPHIFAEVKASTSEEVLNNWDEIKKEEKKRKTATDNLRSVSSAMPALLRAGKIQQKAAKAGFSYSDMKSAVNKINEKYQEICEALKEKDPKDCEDEWGDILFAVSCAIKLAGLEPEQILYKANERFIERFSIMEQIAAEQGKKICELPVNKVEEIWKKAKKVK